MKKFIIITVLFGLSSVMAYLDATQKESTQNNQAEMDRAKKEVADDLKADMDGHRPDNKEEYKKISLKVTDILKKVDASTALELLKPYEQDPIYMVRQSAYSKGTEIIKPLKDVKIRQEMTDRLVKGLSDTDSFVRERVGGFILSLTSADFTDNAKKSIHQLLTAKEPRREEIMACGVADMKEEMKRLEELTKDESDDEALHRPLGVWHGRNWWAARLARARMGSKPDIKRCIELVESYSDDVIRVCGLLEHLSYIRQSEVVELLQKYLNSDKRLPPVKKTDPGALYATYVAAYLAEMLQNFPVKDEGARRSRGYSDDDIKLIREWMSKQKEWKIIR